MHAGSFDPVHPAALAVAGTAALAWLSRERDAALGARLARAGLRLIVVADGEAVPRELARWTGAGIAVAASEQPAHELLLALRRACAEAAAPRQSLHGVLVEVYGLGVLLLGKSAVGKTELALELLARGHRLVADDVVDLLRPGGDIVIGECPPLLRGHVEVRGLGILNARRMFGAAAIADRARVDLVVKLERRTLRRHAVAAERVGAVRVMEPLLGVPTPTLSLAVGLGHNLAVLIETACRDTWLRLAGDNAAASFAARQQKAIDSQKPSSDKRK